MYPLTLIPADPKRENLGFADDLTPRPAIIDWQLRVAADSRFASMLFTCQPMADSLDRGDEGTGGSPDEPRQRAELNRPERGVG